LETTALSSLLLRHLDVPSAPPIAILNSTVDLGGSSATAGTAGKKAAAATERRLGAATGGL
jgi:large subunit ribosomal protein L7/L12